MCCEPNLILQKNSGGKRPILAGNKPCNPTRTITTELKKQLYTLLSTVNCVSTKWYRLVAFPSGRHYGGGRGGDPLTEGSGLINNLTDLLFVNVSNLIANERADVAPWWKSVSWRTVPTRTQAHDFVETLGDSRRLGHDAVPEPKKKSLGRSTGTFTASQK